MQIFGCNKEERSYPKESTILILPRNYCQQKIDFFMSQKLGGFSCAINWFLMSQH